MNISTYIPTNNLFDYREFELFLPKVDPSFEMDDDIFGTKLEIRANILESLENKEHYIEFIGSAWQRLYDQLAKQIMRKTIGRKEYFVTRFIPHMKDEQGYMIILELRAECFVAPTRNVYIPEIIYTPTSMGWNKMKEWRCGYCRSPNEMESRHCTQCGSPRALLLQEM